jgi:hypothetical protein
MSQNELSEENNRLKQIINDQQNTIESQLLSTPTPEPGPLASAENFRLISGIDEIPEKYKSCLNHVLATSTQWMYIKSPQEEADWIGTIRHVIRIWKMYNPNANFTKSDEEAVVMYAKIHLNRSYGGFERNAIITNIQQVNHQTQPIAPQTSTSKANWLEKLIPWRK